jgi:hypothetical protein
MNLTTLRAAIAVLTLATAGIHGILLNIGMGTLDPAFTLNAIGYLVLMGVLLFVRLPFLKGREALVHYAYMAFTAVTIVAYFAINESPFTNPLGLVTKAIEVLLIVALWLHLRAAQA